MSKKRGTVCGVVNKMNNYFRKIIITSLLYVLTGLLFVNAQPYSSNHQKVKSLFQSNVEPTAKDAVWTANDIFKVGVINDGYNRDGYASYVCEILYEHGFRGQRVWVQIIDIMKLTRNNKWVKLGQAHCK